MWNFSHMDQGGYDSGSKDCQFNQQSLEQNCTSKLIKQQLLLLILSVSAICAATYFVTILHIPCFIGTLFYWNWVTQMDLLLGIQDYE